MRSEWLILLAILCSSCGGTIMPQYEQERVEALAAPVRVSNDWSPDGRIAISERMLQTIAAESMKTALADSTKLDISGPGFSGRPKLKLASLTLSEGSCKQCLDVSAALTGDLAWTLLMANGNTPFEADARLEALVEIAHDNTGWEVTMRPQKVKQVRLRTDGWSGALDAALATPLERWLEKNVEALIPVIPIAEFPAESLPVRAARARSLDGALVVEFLASSAPAGRMPPVKLRQGRSVALATTALVDQARAEMFRKGPNSAGVVVTPTRINISRQNFELEMRVWRLKGAGWWRDYRVLGNLEAKPQVVVLTTTAVEEVAQSPGAAFVDPLAALGETLILKTIQNVITTSFPNTKSLQLGSHSIDARVKAAYGESGFLVVSGATKIK